MSISSEFNRTSPPVEFHNLPEIGNHFLELDNNPAPNINCEVYVPSAIREKLGE